MWISSVQKLYFSSSPKISLSTSTIYHHHHWSYSSKRSLASSSKHRHLVLSWATDFQFLNLIFLKSFSTPSIHLNLGLPRPLWPPGLLLINLSLHSFSSILTIWPAHLSLLIFIMLIIFGSPKIWYNSLLNLFLQLSFSKTGPRILRRILLSNTFNFLSSSFVNVRARLMYYREECLSLKWFNKLKYDLDTNNN